MKKHTSTARASGSHERSDEGEDRRELATAARFYLQLEPRQLPSRYLYDALGSALFDAICQLPWYRITRAERELLASHGHAIFDRLPELGSIVELGGGNGEKLAALLEAA